MLRKMKNQLHRATIVSSQRTLVPLGLVIAVFVIVGCGSPSPDSNHSDHLPHLEPAEIIEPLGQRPEHADLEPVHWWVLGAPRGNRVEIYSERGYCAGEVQPKFKAVRVVERGDHVMITPYVQKPVSSNRGVCGGIGGYQRGIIELGQAIRGAKLYDPTTSPPALRWPALDDVMRTG